ncbi:TPA: hypothetical protein ACX6Q6_003565 [Photobacterium damselae]
MFASGIGATGQTDWFTFVYVGLWATCMVVGCTKAIIKWYKNRGKPKQPKPVYKVPTIFQ